MRTAYINARLFDGTDDCEVMDPVTIIVYGDRIEEVRSGEGSSTIGPNDADKVVDLRGAFVMPGMINAHAHHFGFGKPSSTLSGGMAQKAILAFARTPVGKVYLHMVGRKCLEAALFSGVTTQRGVGDFFYTDVLLRDQINAGKFVGPRFIVSGPAITTPDGHGAGTFAECATTPDEFASLVDERADHGVDFIKICTTGGVMDSQVKGEAGLLRMNVEQTRAVCDRARAYGLYVASHTEGPEGVMVDLEGGVYTVEHGAPVDEEGMALWKRSGAADILTAAVAYPLSVLPTSQTKLYDVGQYNSKVVFDRIIQAARDCLAAGVPVGLGTDAACPFVTHYDLWHDVYLFHTMVGATPGQALRTVTLGNARILGIAEETGSVEAGKSADFIVLQKDPLQDLRALAQVDKVVIRGQLLDGCVERLAPYRLAAVDEVLAGLYQ